MPEEEEEKEEMRGGREKKFEVEEMSPLLLNFGHSAAAVVVLLPLPDSHHLLHVQLPGKILNVSLPQVHLWDPSLCISELPR